jgi:hypothetical protein
MEQKVSKNNYDFCGWATRNDLLCGDGRTIRKDAFKHNDGEIVPIFWNHDQTSIENVLGHALLENRDEGVYAYGKFNETENGTYAKEVVRHGDIKALSIYANKLRQIGMDVIHGTIRELSLVPAGANPGAFIDFIVAHGEDSEDAFVAGYDENIMIIQHSESSSASTDEKTKEEKTVAESNNERTLQQVYDEMTDEQKTVVHAFVGLALEADEDDDDIEHSEGGNDTMKTNVFDQAEVRESNVLTHSDQKEILKMAKDAGSFQKAFAAWQEDNALMHADGAEAVSGFNQVSTINGNGPETTVGIEGLFPVHKDVKPTELLTADQGWVSVVMSKVHKSPIARIRTSFVDIRKADELNLRARGYKKGDPKAPVGNFKLARRTTDPQTIYVKNVLHRDDILDIEDFDYVKYLYDINKMMLNEELATAILFGDGREDGDTDKIESDKIRPIWLDDDLYTLHYDLDLNELTTELQGNETNSYFGKNFVRAESLVNKILYAREKYKGSGTPDCFIEPHELNVMLLARDRDGHRIYSSKSELAAALNVGNIYTVEQMLGKTRTTTDGKVKKPLCIIGNLADYSLGSMKGGQVTHFTQFDIDYNQEKSLLETRCSGATTKLYSFIAIEEDITEAAG